METTLQANRFARRHRHGRIFSKAYLLKLQMVELISFISSPFKRVASSASLLGARDLTLKTLERGVYFGKALLPASPQKNIMAQAVIFSVAALTLTSITPGGSFSEASVANSSEYISTYSMPGDILISDQEGYLVKMNPQTNTANRVGLTDFAVHTVDSGETLSAIASLYGVSVSTIMWENNLSNANSLRVGQKLMVPPVDGVSYKVGAGDTLNKIAAKYSVSMDSIIAQNALSSDVVARGQTLFLPGAKPLAAPTNIASGRATTVTRNVRAGSAVSASPSNDAPVAGKVFIFPTIGKITQGFKAGHYALDIGNRNMPPIWAAGAGTIEKVSTGTWGGGYGNHVIIDHGNGLKTLYAHMDSVSVSEGQAVNQGDVLGVMGNTGRVYGVTGIHLHWEVIENGVKKYPGNYY